MNKCSYSHNDLMSCFDVYGNVFHAAPFEVTAASFAMMRSHSPIHLRGRIVARRYTSRIDTILLKIVSASRSFAARTLQTALQRHAQDSGSLNIRAPHVNLEVDEPLYKAVAAAFDCVASVTLMTKATANLGLIIGLSRQVQWPQCPGPKEVRTY